MVTINAVPPKPKSLAARLWEIGCWVLIGLAFLWMATALIRGTLANLA